MVKCKKCGQEVDYDITCFDCRIKDIEENPGTCPCDFCGVELLGRTADKEITLFYKDSDKDYNFCSKDCLIKFVSKLD